MDYRHKLLADTLAGLEKSGVPLVAVDGSGFKAAGFADDPAIYYFVPKIARLFGVSIEAGIDTFFIGILSISLFVAVVSAVKLCKTKQGRVWAVLNLLLTGFISFRVGDLYSIAPAVVMFTVLPFLLLYGKGEAKRDFILLAIAGLACGLANETRAHAGSGALIFLVFYLFFSRGVSRSGAALNTAILLVSFVIPSLFFGHLAGERDRYLLENRPGYTSEETGNTIWHSVYIGLGYLKNPFVAEYRDDVGFSRANEIKPGVAPFTSGYEKILKGEVIRILSEHPYFAFQNISAKGGVLLMFFLLFANVGIAAAWFYGARGDAALPLAAAIVFSALPGILVVPYHEYLLGFFAFSALFNLLHADNALSKGGVADMLKFVGRYKS
ncbi:MAG: hypothetical protein OEY64_09475 [Nitrospinota bacterium]|nr:hypothetical protein [Nitrospinota bacterium]